MINAALIDLLPGASTVDATALDDLRVPGAYLLAIDLAAPVKFARRTIGPALLGGRLYYAGSANGPGGIGARLARHFRRDKPVHWHVDELTLAAERIAALALPRGSECAIVARLLASGRFEIALPGFGSSDCRSCVAHLIAPSQ